MTIKYNIHRLAAICLTSSALTIISANAASIVAGSLVQGDVRHTMSGNSYAKETNKMNDWALDTGGWGGNTVAVSLTNPNFNGNAWGGTVDTMVAFGNGGTVTLQLDSAISSSTQLGLFTAQAINAGRGNHFNGNMEAAILLSSDGNTWKTLNGQTVSAGYTAFSSSLNAPTMAYNYETLATAWSYGSPGTSDANLAKLNVANYRKPMVNDSLFNGNGTDAQRLALKDNTSTEDYDNIFGDSGGGNWFDLSKTGLNQIEYVKLNAVNCDRSMGIRLDGVYTTIPEPSVAALLAIAALIPLRRKR